MIIAVFSRLIGELPLRFQEKRISILGITKQGFNTFNGISVIDIVCLICDLDLLPYEIWPPRKVVIYDLIQLL
jgi:hypothetical protein